MTEHYLQLAIDGQLFVKEVHRKEKVQSDFLRKVVCELIAKPEATFWKDCIRSPAELEAEFLEMTQIIVEIGLKTAET